MMPALDQIMLAVSSTLAASIIFKATVLLAAGLLGAFLARQRTAALRHTVLAATFAVLLVLPAASLLAPPVRLVVPAPAQQQVLPPFTAAGPAIPLAASLRGAAPAVAAGWSVRYILLAGWIAGMTFFLAPVAIGLWQVRWLRRSGLPWSEGQAIANRLAADAGVPRRLAVLLHEDLQSPMTCGAYRPAILLPMEARRWDCGDLERAIVHELEHVRRGDWAGQCFARAVCAAYWFHPLVWAAWRRLILEAERSCDDAVLRRFDATAYAGQLVLLAQRLSSAGKSPLPAMAGRSDLATRVGAVLDSRQRRGRAGTLPVAVAFSVAAAAVFAISPFRTMAASPNSAASAPAGPVAQAAQFAITVAEPQDDAPPQGPSPASQTLPQIQFNVRTFLVMVNVTVTDMTGKSIEGLGARDFVLTEDSVRQAISIFEYQKVGTPAGAQGSPTSYYILGYYTSNAKADGQFRKIQVTDLNDTTANVQCRSGYYAKAAAGATPAGPGAIGPALPPGSTPPILLYKKQPEYTDEARNAKYQGTVLLTVEVGTDGTATNIKVVRSLRLGLDEKAIEAVKQWKFKPGTANGVPVAMATQVSVDFRLM